MPQWKRKVGTAQPDRSNGYATGLIALVLQQSGVSRDDAGLRCGLLRAMYGGSKATRTGGTATSAPIHRTRFRGFAMSRVILWRMPRRPLRHLR
jgi:hypothetical protein